MRHIAVAAGVLGAACTQPVVDPQCAEVVVQLGTADAVSRDHCQLPTAQEDSLLAQRDVLMFGGWPETFAHRDAVEALRLRGHIAASVPLHVVTDLQTMSRFVGGQAGHGAVFLDGKFADILSEYATYVTLARYGLTTVPRDQAVDAIVANHNSARGVTLAPTLFPPTLVPPTLVAEAELTREDYIGVGLFHEFGHHWTWAMLDFLRAQYDANAQFFFYPAKLEDDADYVAGVLARRAGITPARGIEMFDLMTFYALQRQFAVNDIAQVEQSYQLQFVQQAPSYSALAVRKQIYLRGWNDMDAFLRARPADPSLDARPPDDASPDAAPGVPPCSVSQVPSLTCRYPNRGGQIVNVTTCCLSDEPLTSSPRAAVEVGEVFIPGECDYAGGRMAGPTTDADYAECHASGGLACQWPQGSVTCPALYRWTSSNGEAVYVPGCCGVVQTGGPPRCGAAGSSGSDDPHSCGPPLANMTPVP